MQRLNIALAGNPNSGKSSLFNALTGLNQKVGNFPGVTVDKKTGLCKLNEEFTANVIDLPGTYSLYPKGADEMVTYDLLLNPDNPDKPDMIVVVADASNLKRNLLFCSQIIDLKIPTVIALTMMDLAKKKGTEIDLPGLEREFGVPVVSINPRKNKGISHLKRALVLTAEKQYKAPAWDFVDMHAMVNGLAAGVRSFVPVNSDYAALHVASHVDELKFLNGAQRLAVKNIITEENFNKTKTQGQEILQRYEKIKQIMKNTVVEQDPLYKSMLTEKIDNILLHKVWGYVIMLAILFFVFQSIFSFAQYPMNAIQEGFGLLSGWLGTILPAGWVTNLLINGIIAGISGIAVFIPQIMILFGFITILEDTGYMARISFLTDRVMRQVGLNGRSVMPMISGLACAVPAIMATRGIENKKQRLITILITPLMTCSARLPVYVIIIALVIPNKYLFGFLSLQGAVMMLMYFLGFFMALIVAFVMQFIIKIKDKNYFIMELPVYRAPRWKNIGTTMVQKGKIFAFDAGKVILIISLILWFLASYGPPKQMKQISSEYAALIQQHPNDQKQLEINFQSERLEHSFAGYMGKAIEPVIRPLGFDWKIGIALVTSFAAREVFVGTMATLYSVGENPEHNTTTLTQKMRDALRPDGSRVFTLATGLSLLIFYAFAMQCMTTLAIVYKETKTLKYPIIQFLYMTGLAYFCSMIVYFLFAH
ncbi:MAG: ferrous iron transport protein B [Chitinophagaceae bacterium]|nr:MAG: ferrous iron transport protein B [Chitinophagaceae bacterium]